MGPGMNQRWDRPWSMSQIPSETCSKRLHFGVVAPVSSVSGGDQHGLYISKHSAVLLSARNRAPGCTVYWSLLMTRAP
jgi:hypothetical protein